MDRERKWYRFFFVSFSHCRHVSKNKELCRIRIYPVRYFSCSEVTRALWERWQYPLLLVWLWHSRRLLRLNIYCYHARCFELRKAVLNTPFAPLSPQISIWCQKCNVIPTSLAAQFDCSSPTCRHGPVPFFVPVTKQTGLLCTSFIDSWYSRFR